MRYGYSPTNWNPMLHVVEREANDSDDWPYATFRCGRSFTTATVVDNWVDIRPCPGCFDIPPEAFHVVYLAQDARGLIKIGTTRYRDKRVRAVKAELLAWLPGDVRTEAALHQVFAHLRVTGEWFRPEPDLLAFIDRVRSIEQEVAS
jgi:hypothetical protein